MIKTTIYTDVDHRVWTHQELDEEGNETRTEHQVDELPNIEPRKTAPNLYDGYLIYQDGVFSFGYELNVNKCYGAIKDLKVELSKTDYISLKEMDGEDISSYGDYKNERQEIRVKINEIENLINERTNQIK